MFVKKKQYRSRVLGKEREPDIVGSGDRPAQRVLVDVPDLEVFEEASSPTLFYSHRYPP